MIGVGLVGELEELPARLQLLLVSTRARAQAGPGWDAVLILMCGLGVRADWAGPVRSMH